MRKLTFLGKTGGSGENGCPSAYRTDDGGCVLQGVTLTDTGEIAQLRQLADGETAMYVPADVIALLLEHQ